MNPKIKINTTDFMYSIKGLYDTGTLYLTSLIPSDLNPCTVRDAFTHKGRIIEKAIEASQNHKKESRLIALDITQK